MTDTTTRLNLPLIAAQQAQKHVTHNEALEMLDALLQAVVIRRDLASPPSAPEEGEAYIIAPGAEGEWAGREGAIARFQNGGWVFFTPGRGWLVHVIAEGIFVFFDGTHWSELSAAVGALQNLLRLGINTTADDTNRLAVKSDAVLFSHDDVSGRGSGDVRMKFNKAAAGRTASLVFQDNWSGRAEIGLAGNDDLVMKVSADGGQWTEALHIRAATGEVGFPTTPLAENLLINGDFAINQRGFQGGALAAGEYGYDRWKAGTAGATISVGGDLTVSLRGEIVQVLESPGLAGASLVLSVEDLAGSDLQVDAGGATATITQGAGRRHAVIEVPSSVTGDVTVRIAAGATASFRRAMLVRGVRPSPWRPRPPAMEMLLCRRYFQRFSYRQYQSVAAARINWDRRVDFILRYLQPMRRTPAIRFENPNAIDDVFEVVGPSGVYFTSYRGVFRANEYEATLTLEPVGGDAFRPGYIRCRGPQQNVHFSLDAEL
jgi:hypothetical protein